MLELAIQLVPSCLKVCPLVPEGKEVCQVATPLASEVKTLPAACVPFSNLNEPATCNFVDGAAVPIPTFPLPCIRINSLLAVDDVAA